MRQKQIDPSHSILKTEWYEPSRPYSKLEIADLYAEISNRLGLSDLNVYHEECGHSYLVKKNGNKYKQLVETNEKGNCSICWKFRKTPRFLHEAAQEFISLVDPSKQTYLGCTVYRIFYTWLYQEVFN